MINNNFFSNKELQDYGIVYTPEFFVEKILDIIPKKYINNKYKFLDIGSGTGNFVKVLLKKLTNNSENYINQITNYSITMVDNNSKHIKILQETFGYNSKIIECNFLDDNQVQTLLENNYDVIIGNPPYNINGKIKTPTNNNIVKKNDGITVYPYFVENSLELLNIDGLLCFIIPILWLKPDKYNLYYKLTEYEILKLHILNNFENNKYFNYKCQTPTCFFLLKKKKVLTNNYKIINIFDKYTNSYVKYKLYKNLPIPIHGISIINNAINMVRKYGNLNVIKTNMPSNSIKISNIQNDYYIYPNIRTCIKKNIITNNTKFYENYDLLINYSDKPLIFNNIPKIVMAHKVYGIPFFDISGKYGISQRDNYVIKDYKINQLEILKYYLQSKTIMFIFSTTRYRMQYLEKYCFEFIPNILKYDNIYDINYKIDSNIDNFLYNFFGFTSEEINIIENNYFK